MKYLSILLLSLPIVLGSCEKKDEPVEPANQIPQYKISSNHSEVADQIFKYNSDGDVSEWRFIDNQYLRSDAYAFYNYDKDKGVIKIEAETEGRSEKWMFEETLVLDSEQKAESAEGVAQYYEYKNGDYIFAGNKKYTISFQYNELNELELIRSEEKWFNDNGEESYPLTWFVKLRWENGNPIEHKAYSNESYPFYVDTYSYFENVDVEIIPIVQNLILRPFYTPLQYQDLFGKIPKKLLKSYTTEDSWGIYEVGFNYNIVTIDGQTAIKDYFATSSDGSEIKYTLDWINLK